MQGFPERSSDSEQLNLLHLQETCMNVCASLSFRWLEGLDEHFAKPGHLVSKLFELWVSTL